MNNYSLSLTDQQIQMLKEALDESYLLPKKQYVLAAYRYPDCTITIYESHKVVFQGKEAYTFASPFLVADSNQYPQCGSDEVGTGDYFGPVIVVCSLVKEEDITLLKQLGVTDSKALTDQKIRTIAPKLIEKIPYTINILSPSKYNEVHPRNNMNMIKAKMHNQCFLLLQKKLGNLPDSRIIDQFTPENNYYNYLREMNEIVKGIHFETKAESKYLSVAVSSVIARYNFLEYMDKLSEKYGLSFPKGAGKPVDDFLLEFMKNHSYQELEKIAKISFKNTDKLN